MISSSQTIREMLPLIIAVAVLFTVIMAADIALLLRWLFYRGRQYQAAPPEEVSASLPPSVSGGGAGAMTLQNTRELVASPKARALFVANPSAPHSPFAPTWSLVHPFVGFQLAMLVATAIALIPPVAAMLFLLPKAAGNVDRLMSYDLMRNTTYVAAILASLLQNALFVGVVAYFVAGYGKSLKYLGLRRPTRGQIGLGLGLGVALVVIASGLEWGWGQMLAQTLPHQVSLGLKKIHEQASAEGLFFQLPGVPLRLALTLVGVIAAPIGEEIFFRGFVYNALKARFSLRLSLVLSGFIFAVVHFSPFAIPIIFLMGVALAYVYERTRSLWITILMHAINNSVAFALLWMASSRGH